MSNMKLGKREQTLIDFLEYKLIGPDNSNRWIILDKDDNNVGYIQYKKTRKKSKKNPAVYDYITNINSKEIVYSEDSIINSLSRDKFDYDFYIKRENNEFEYVEVKLGEHPSITLRTKKYGYINFSKDHQGIYLEFPSKTENFNLKEIVILRTINEDIDHQEYIYTLSYCDKSKKIDSDEAKGITTRELVGMTTRNMQSLGQIAISNTTMSGNTLKMKRKDVVFGTLEEMILKQQSEICTFEHFKYVINNLWPFESELLSKLLENSKLTELEKTLIGVETKSKKK